MILWCSAVLRISLVNLMVKDVVQADSDLIQEVYW